MADETQNLILNVQGRERVQELTEAIQQEEKWLKEAIATFGQASAASKMHADTIIGMKSALTEAQKAVASTGPRFQFLQQRVTAAGFAFQDFTSTSGDLGQKLNSVSNNLPMLMAGMGGLATAVSIAGTAAIALYRSWDSIAGLFQSKNPFPKAAGDLAGLSKELDKAKKEMAELEKNSELTAAQLSKYNDLRARTAELEKKVADEQERQARVKGLLGLKDTEKTAAEKERADALSPMFGDPENKALIKAVSGAMPRDAKAKLSAQYKEALDAVSKNLASDPLDLTGMQGVLQKRADDLGKAVRAEEERILKEAQQLTADAVVGGKEDAFNRILDLMGKRPDAFTQKQRDAFEGLSGFGKQERRDLAAKLGVDQNGNPVQPGAGGGEGAGGAGGGAGGGGGGRGGAGGAAAPGVERIVTPDGKVLTGEAAAQWQRDEIAGKHRFQFREPGAEKPPPPGMGKGPRRNGESGPTAGETRRARIEAETQRQHALREMKAARAKVRAGRRPTLRPSGAFLDAMHPSAPGPEAGRAMDELARAEREAAGFDVPELGANFPRNTRQPSGVPIQARRPFVERLTPGDAAGAHPRMMAPPGFGAAAAPAAQQAADTILAENARLRAELAGVNQVLGRVAKGMQQQRAQQGADAKRQQADGDSFLPPTW